MNIRELNTNTGSVTVSLNYNELKCINNSMYRLSKIDDVKKDENFNVVRARVIELFTLVKYGMIPAFELGLICKLCNQEDFSFDEEGELDA